MTDVLMNAATDPAAYPLWMLFSPEVLKQINFATSLAHYRTLDGEIYAAVFTDKDLALRFLEENPPAGIELIPVENRARFIYLLTLLNNKGVLNVGTDLSTAQFHHFPQRGQLRTIAIVLEELKNLSSE